MEERIDRYLAAQALLKVECDTPMPESITASSPLL
jgi:hypothetical protein